MIAYSMAYLNGGALAAIYSSPENVGRQTADLISRGKLFPTMLAAGIYRLTSPLSSTALWRPTLDVDLKPKQFYLDRLKAE